MIATPPSLQATRQDLFDQIASITTMQSGTLAEEWRLLPRRRPMCSTLPATAQTSPMRKAELQDCKSQ